MAEQPASSCAETGTHVKGNHHGSRGSDTAQSWWLWLVKSVPRDSLQWTWWFSSLCVIQRCSRKVETAQGWLNSREHFPASNHVCLILGLSQWRSVLKPPPFFFLSGLICPKATPDLLLLAKLLIFNIILFLVSLIFSYQHCCIV